MLRLENDVTDAESQIPRFSLKVNKNLCKVDEARLLILIAVKPTASQAEKVAKTEKTDFCRRSKEKTSKR